MDADFEQHADGYKQVTPYVVGLAFSECGKHVLLVRKNRPAWMKGKWNGVGGHVEAGEQPLEAMAREFLEETGVDTPFSAWTHFLTVTTPVSRVWFYACKTDAIYDARQTTDELVHVWRVDGASSYWEGVTPNLRWVLPLATRAHDILVPIEAVNRTEEG